MDNDHYLFDYVNDDHYLLMVPTKMFKSIHYEMHLYNSYHDNSWEAPGVHDWGVKGLSHSCQNDSL